MCLGKEKINFAEDLGNLCLNPKFFWLQILVPLYIFLIHEYEIINCELNYDELACTDNLLYVAAAAAAAADAAKSVVSDSVRPHRRQPTRLPCPWDSPGRNTGVGCHFLLQ